MLTSMGLQNSRWPRLATMWGHGHVEVKALFCFCLWHVAFVALFLRDFLRHVCLNDILFGKCYSIDKALCSSCTCKPAELAAGCRPRKNFGLAAVDFAKLPAAGEKKIRLSRRLILPTLNTSDKFNVSPVEKTKYCRKSDSMRDSDNIYFLLSQTSRISGL